MMAYNSSAIKGIEVLLEEQKDSFLNLIKDAYIQSNKDDKIHIFEYMENDPDENEKQNDSSKIRLTNFLHTSCQSDYYSVSVYSAVDNTVYSFLRSQLRSYSGDSEIFQKLKDTYIDTRSRIEIEFSKLAQLYKGEKCYSIRYCIRDLDFFNNIGSIQADIKTNTIDNLLEKSYPSVKGSFMVLDNYGNVIYDSEGKWQGQCYPWYKQIITAVDDRKAIRLGDGSYYINSSGKGLEYYRSLHVVGMIHEDEVNKSVKMTVIYMLEIMGILLTLLLVFMYLNIRNKRKILREIHHAMECAKSGNLEITIDTNEMDQNELTDIAVSFNMMTRELKEHIEREYTWKMEQQHYQLMALQAQINPHFLYNSLEAIRMKAELSGEEEIGKMVYILSKIFRNAAKGNGILRIGLEVQNCENFLELHKIRFPEQLGYSINVDEKVRKYAIVQHAIQVIVENYIIHGFDSSRKDNHIEIIGEMQDGWITFTVKDNSEEITQESLNVMRSYAKCQDSEERGHIGLKNVCQRMRIIFGEGFSYTADVLEGGGLVQQLRFKACFEEELLYDIPGNDSR